MKIIDAQKIKKIVKELCIRANTNLRKDIIINLKYALEKEDKKIACKILEAIIKNALIAEKENLAICQDTGLPVVFLEIGKELRIKGNLHRAVEEGVILGYKNGYLRNSIVEPLKRKKPRFGPPVIHTEFINQKKLIITVLPKGFGCENKTKLKMFNPTASWKEIKDFVIQTVKSAGPDACPPFVIGVGIGGTADYACFLAKKALLRNINARINKLENELLREINLLDIGPMGLGGKTTCLGVNILTYPTHIAGLPVAVNISCHALRSATESLE